MKNKIRSLIFERTRSKQIIVYHGTSSKFARSILKKGFDPNAKEKVWANDKSASFYNLDRTSFYGTYFTKQVMTAVFFC